MSAPAISFDSVVALVDQFPVLAGLDLVVDQGECIMLRGANGSGKTSLLRAIAGLIPIASGSAQVMGFDVDRDRKAVRANVAYLGHTPGLYGDLTVKENIEFVGQAVRSESGAITAAINSLDLMPFSAVLAARASAGQRRRVALACLMVKAKPLWLLDEPYSGLDAATRKTLDGVIGQATEAGTTVVFSSHEYHPALSYREIAIAGGTAQTAIDLKVPTDVS